jgi:hypothetical protein
MVRRRRLPDCRARSALAWAAFFLIAGQVGLAVFVSRVRPEARDPEFGTLLTALRQRLEEAPGRPLVLVLGSSRTATSIRPTALGSGGKEPLVFNMSLIGSGPIRELQIFRRLRAEGIRPDAVVVEVWPPYLLHDERFAEEPYFLARDVQWAEWPVLALDPADRRAARRKLLEGLLVPIFAHRDGLLRWYAPVLGEREDEELIKPGWEDYSQRTPEAGWLPNPNRPFTPAEVACWRLWYLCHVAPVLRDFQVHPIKDRDLRELLAECARDGTRVALVWSPEHSGLRACYGAETSARVSAYLGQLAAEYGAVVADTRTWMADEDFAEFTHLLPRSAAPYTERLGREVLGPLLGDCRLSRSLASR